MRIIIMRHGKADYAGLDRVLTSQGRVEAQMTARKLAAHYDITDVYSSPKTRAMQTAEAVCGIIGLQDKIHCLPSLSPAGDPAFVESVVEAECSPESTVLLLSHIPCVEHLAYYLTAQESVPLFVTGSALIVRSAGLRWRMEAYITPQTEEFFDPVSKY